MTNPNYRGMFVQTAGASDLQALGNSAQSAQTITPQQIRGVDIGDLRDGVMGNYHAPTVLDNINELGKIAVFSDNEFEQASAIHALGYIATNSDNNVAYSEAIKSLALLVTLPEDMPSQIGPEDRRAALEQFSNIAESELSPNSFHGANGLQSAAMWLVDPELQAQAIGHLVEIGDVNRLQTIALSANVDAIRNHAIDSISLMPESRAFSIEDKADVLCQIAAYGETSQKIEAITNLSQLALQSQNPEVWGHLDKAVIVSDMQNSFDEDPGLSGVLEDAYSLIDRHSPMLQENTATPNAPSAHHGTAP